MDVNRISRIVIFLVALTLTGIALMSRADKPDPGSATLEFRGEIVHLAIEGGFWGIVAKDGRRFDPGAIPAEYQHAGLRVRVVARPAQGRLSFRQWGQAVDIVALERDGQP